MRDFALVYPGAGKNRSLGYAGLQTETIPYSACDALHNTFANPTRRDIWEANRIQRAKLKAEKDRLQRQPAFFGFHPYICREVTC
jgi:hypothetical protein